MYVGKQAGRSAGMPLPLSIYFGCAILRLPGLGWLDPSINQIHDPSLWYSVSDTMAFCSFIFDSSFHIELIVSLSLLFPSMHPFYCDDNQWDKITTKH